MLGVESGREGRKRKHLPCKETERRQHTMALVCGFPQGTNHAFLSLQYHTQYNWCIYQATKDLRQS